MPGSPPMSALAVRGSPSSASVPTAGTGSRARSRDLVAAGRRRSSAAAGTSPACPGHRGGCASRGRRRCCAALPELLATYAGEAGRRARLRRPARLGHRRRLSSTCWDLTRVDVDPGASRRWRWPGPGWAGRRSRPRSSRWSAATTTRVRRYLAPGRRLLVLSSDETTPAAVAATAGPGRVRRQRASRCSATSGRPDESRLDATAATWRTADVTGPQRALRRRGRGPGDRALSLAPGLPDDGFEHDGQLTKRDLRALGPGPAGAAARPAALGRRRRRRLGRHRVDARPPEVPRDRRRAVDAERAERIGRNAARLGVPGLRRA